MTHEKRYDALLVVGPTGVGKTPFGMACERDGLWGRVCAHFDFGQALREAAAVQPRRSPLNDADTRIVRHAIDSGALLEDEQFHIARELFFSFARTRGIGYDHVVVLNGLPRHVGQAERVDEFVRVKMLLHLVCDPHVVAERIRLNTGGDRTGRTDDAPEDVERKLQVFMERTLPLIDHYRDGGVPVEEIPVSVHTAPEQMLRILNG